MAVRVAKKVRKKGVALRETKSSSGAMKASSDTATVETDEPKYTIAIRYRVDDRIEDLQPTTDDRSFYPFAQRWRYVVANRKPH